ncbi:hypothetical protein HY768_06025 [candidate division TA06 bacterium]|uniref:Galactose oxidase n=1 Tax=candidate division TA06 bacterium TaxID=2250710 RepID=A0A933IA98_UNCT6|nr:hypothetical protein [candidate division TA06 bacterium]
MSSAPQRTVVYIYATEFRYILTGKRGNYLTDLWEYDTTSDTWTRKADFPGTPRDRAVGFSIGTKGYIGTGASGFF